MMTQRRARKGPARLVAHASLDEVKRTLRCLIESNAGIPAAEVDDESAVDADLAMDSMSFLALQVAVEETFGIDCTPDEILAANTFAAIAALVQERATRSRGVGGASRPRPVALSAVKPVTGRGQAAGHPVRARR